MKAYKLLTRNGTASIASCIQRHNVRYKLPDDGEIGKWQHYPDRLIMCKQGYHVCPTIEDARQFFATVLYSYPTRPFVLWECEIGEEYLKENNGEYTKYCARDIRLIKKIAVINKEADFLTIGEE